MVFPKSSSKFNKNNSVIAVKVYFGKVCQTDKERENTRLQFLNASLRAYLSRDYARRTLHFSNCDYFERIRFHIRLPDKL